MSSLSTDRRMSCLSNKSENVVIVYKLVIVAAVAKRTDMGDFYKADDGFAVRVNGR